MLTHGRGGGMLSQAIWKVVTTAIPFAWIYNLKKMLLLVLMKTLEESYFKQQIITQKNLHILNSNSDF